MDADVAGELSSLRADLGAAQSVLNNWRLNGLETLTQQRAFTFGQQKVRADNFGITVQLPSVSGPDTIFFHAVPIMGPDFSTQYPRIDGLAQRGSNSAVLYWNAYGPTDANDYARVYANGAIAPLSSAGLLAVTGGTTAAELQVSANTGGFVLVNPRISFTGLTVDPATPINGTLWYRSDTNVLSARLNGATVNLVTSSTTVDILTQYALLAGRATPQQLNFGTASGAATGYLSSTANATKGKYGLNAALTMVVDDLNVRLGVGTGSPSDAVHTTGSFRSNSNIAFNNYFASQFAASYNAFQSRGTVASPTASQSGDQVIVFAGNSCIAAGTYSANNIGNFQLYTEEIQDSTHYGSGWLWQSTPLGTTVPQDRLRITANGNFLTAKQAALATTATDGFLYIPTCAGTPTGVPTGYTGLVPLIFDTTGNQLWIRTGGAWKQPKVLGAATVVDWQ